MTATDVRTDHDIQPYAMPVDFGGRVRGYSARCTVHNASTSETWGNWSQAGREFHCDGGKELRFVTEFRGDDIDTTPGLCDLSGLARIVRGDAEAHAYGQDYGTTRAWLWLGAGQVEEVAITLAWVRPFDLNDYATQCWQIARQDGTVLTEVHVRIDGRS
jgi:hypothetical protein